MYKLAINDIILRISDNANIPFDAANIDYQEYLKWLEDGNVPEQNNKVEKPEFVSDL